MRSPGGRRNSTNRASGETGAVHFYDAPEVFNCNDATQADMDLICQTKFPGDHEHCVEYYIGGNQYFGCFMQPTFDGSPAGYVVCKAGASDDDDEISHSSCVVATARNEATSVVETRYLLMECGNDGDWIQDLALPWVNAANPTLLQNCYRGTLVSCCSTDDCGSDGGVAPDDYVVTGGPTIPTAVVPHDMNGNAVLMDEHIYCRGYYCSVDDRRSCCHLQYAGTRPFESVESRLIRDLVNNLGNVSFLLDMHSSASELKFRCTNSNNGCVDADPHYLNGQNLEDGMVGEYNTAAEGHWAPHLVGTPDVLVNFLRLKRSDEGTPGLSYGYLTSWSASKALRNAGNPYTHDNFDNDTVRAILSFTWELGALPYSSAFNQADPVNGTLANFYNRIVGCSETDTGRGGQPASRVMVENQLAGARGLIRYLAGQAQTPNAAYRADGTPFDEEITDVAMVGMRIHDGHGRSMQVTESRWDKIDDDTGDDPDAVIVIPAGLWSVETTVAAGWSPGTSANPDPGSLPCDMDLTIKKRTTAGLFVFWQIVDEYTVSGAIPTNTRERFEHRFRFEAGEVYEITAEATLDPAPATGSTLANDVRTVKVRVEDCRDEFQIPHEWFPDLEDWFCRQGIPIPDDRFECNDSNGKCRECWSDAWDEQECDGAGAFCFEGMCDDPDTCWSGQMEDSWEVSEDTEIPLVFFNDGTETSSITRSLFEKPDTSGAPVWDLDRVFVQPESVEGDGIRYLEVRFQNLCDKSSPPKWDVPIEDIQVKISQLAVAYTGDPYDDASYNDITDWESPMFFNGISLPLTWEQTTAFEDGLPLRVMVRKTENDGVGLTYTLEVSMSFQEADVGPEEYIPKTWPWESIVGPMSEVDVDVNDSVAVVTPSADSLAQGGWLHFAPDEGVDVGTVSFVLRDSRGEVAEDQYGNVVGEAVPRHGGLAVPLTDLNTRYAPYRGTISWVRGLEVAGRVYVCPDRIGDCSSYEPTRDICGAGDGEVCCADDNGAYFAIETRGSDEENCGACNLACDWDETCLKGACVGGAATRCWNTVCPTGTYCVSDGWLGKNPRCEAVLVDRDHCGWWGAVCAENQRCGFGLCLPKSRSSCSSECGDGEACCWWLGVETCTDVAEGELNCGVCGNICGWGDLCGDGACVAWTEVLDPCWGGTHNCGADGEIDCHDLADDEENCGGCGRRCDVNGSWCENGVCVVEGGAEAEPEYEE